VIGGVSRGTLVANMERMLTRGEAAHLSEERAALEVRTGSRVLMLSQSGTGVERAERRDVLDWTPRWYWCWWVWTRGMC